MSQDSDRLRIGINALVYETMRLVSECIRRADTAAGSRFNGDVDNEDYPIVESVWEYVRARKHILRVVNIVVSCQCAAIPDIKIVMDELGVLESLLDEIENMNDLKDAVEKLSNAFENYEAAHKRATQ